MRKDDTPISQAHSYQQIGEFWDTRDLADHWDQTEPAEFEMDLRSTATYYPLEQELSKKLRSIAERRGISSETLLNLWVQEKAGEEADWAERSQHPAPTAG